MQYVTHDEFTQKSTMSVSCPGPVVSNGSSTPFVHASDDFLDLVRGMAFHSMMSAFFNVCMQRVE
jgi:hypothetical protein